FLANDQIYAVLHGIAVLCAVLYVFGLVLWIALPYLAILHIAFGSLANSQGGIGHANQMISLILLAQAVVAVSALIISLKEKKQILWRCTEQTGSRIAYYALVAIVVCYLTSGISKVKNSDGKWVWNTPYIASQIVKAEYQSHYSRLEEPLDQDSLERANWLVKHPFAARAIFAPGLLIELLAFFALLSRRWSLVIGLGIIGMHAMIEFFMSLRFPLFQISVAIWMVNPPYWIYVIINQAIAQFPRRHSRTIGSPI
ncbi:MAG: hypothetical protein AAGH89_15715, partial [Verrucomicrobiota bacterium]